MNRKLSPAATLDALRRRQTRAAARLPDWRAYDAMWRTRFLVDIHGRKTARNSADTTGGMQWSEPNTIYPFVTAYVASMAEPNLEFRLQRGADMKGDAKKAQLAINKWVKLNATAFDSQVQNIDRMAVMYDGAGARIMLDTEQPEVLSCVTFDAVPCWEVVPDEDVTNVKKQRYVGHVYWLPVADARELLHDPTIKGGQRVQDSYITGGFATKPRSSASEDGVDDVVCIYEVFNFVDCYYAGEANPLTGVPDPTFQPTAETPKSKGRREFYVVGGPEMPKIVRPLPYSTPTDAPINPLPFLTYLHQPGFPNQGLSHVSRIFDGALDRMGIRTRQVTNTIAQVPQVAAPKDLFDTDARTLYRDGVHGVMEYDKEKIPEGSSPGASVFAMPQQNIVYDNVLLAQAIDKDIAGATLQSPAQRGVVSGGSATEVLQAAETGQSERALLWTDKREFLINIGHAVLAAMRAAMRAKGPGTVIPIVEGFGDDETVTEVTLADLDGAFEIEIGVGEPTKIAEERAIRRTLELTSALLPLVNAALKGDKVAGMFYDELVRKSRLGSRYLLENLRKSAEGTVDSGVQIPRGAGAGSALPGQGSMPAMTAGGPQPETEQPEDTQTGAAQNTTGAT